MWVNSLPNIYEKSLYVHLLCFYHPRVHSLVHQSAQALITGTT